MFVIQEPVDFWTRGTFMEQQSPAALPATVLLLTSQWCTKAVVHSMSGARWRLGSPVITVG